MTYNVVSLSLEGAFFRLTQPATTSFVYFVCVLLQKKLIQIGQIL